MALCARVMAAAVAVAVLAAAPCAGLTTIMPFGDSITEWQCGLRNYFNASDRPIDPATAAPDEAVFVSALGGYRGLLAEKLHTAGLPFAYVGDRWGCGSHSGYSGQTIEYLASIASTTMAANRPDMILFQAGTNDFFYDTPRGCNATEGVARLRSLLDTVFEASPTVLFLISTVPHINATRCADYPAAPWHPTPCPASMNPTIDAFNQLLPGVVAEYKAKGRAIFLHDINAAAAFVADDFWIWGIHFSRQGFGKLAAAWFTAITAALAETSLLPSGG